MAINNELEAGLKAMTEDVHLPGGGRKRLLQLVAEHLHRFDTAESRGMGWRDMIRALTTAGVTGRGGKPLSGCDYNSNVVAACDDLAVKGSGVRAAPSSLWHFSSGTTSSVTQRVQ